MLSLCIYYQRGRRVKSFCICVANNFKVGDCWGWCNSIVIIINMMRSIYCCVWLCNGVVIAINTMWEVCIWVHLKLVYHVFRTLPLCILHLWVIYCIFRANLHYIFHFQCLLSIYHSFKAFLVIHCIFKTFPCDMSHFWSFLTIFSPF